MRVQRGETMRYLHSLNREVTKRESRLHFLFLLFLLSITVFLQINLTVNDNERSLSHSQKSSRSSGGFFFYYAPSKEYRTSKSLLLCSSSLQRKKGFVNATATASVENKRKKKVKRKRKYQSLSTFFTRCNLGRPNRLRSHIVA